jgi:hypothetical protein
MFETGNDIVSRLHGMNEEMYAEYETVQRPLRCVGGRNKGQLG